MGVYTVTIASEISVPTDFWKTDFDTWRSEYDFEIWIGPCKVTSYVGDPIASDTTYIVGRSLMEFG